MAFEQLPALERCGLGRLEAELGQPGAGLADTHVAGHVSIRLAGLAEAELVDCAVRVEVADPDIVLFGGHAGGDEGVGGRGRGLGGRGGGWGRCRRLGGALAEVVHDSVHGGFDSAKDLRGDDLVT